MKEYGIWRVKGEDPNCDIGGHHYSPELGTFEGYLKDILTVAVELPQFWAWGAGGEIKKINVKRVSPKDIEVRNQKRKQLQEVERVRNTLLKDLDLCKN